MRIGPPSKYVVVEVLDDDIVLYDKRKRKYFELNPTASHVWRLATGDFTADEIVDALAEAYDKSESEIREQVEDVINMMVKAKLFANTI